MEELKAETQTDSEAQEEKEEAKTEEETQNEETPEVEEDFDSLPDWAKEKFKKTEEDRDNYRSGLLKWKSEARSLSKTQKEEPQEEDEEWDEVSKRFKQETLTQAEKRAEEVANRVFEKQREQSALEKFHDNHPDLADDANWKSVVAEYKPVSGKTSTKAILQDLEVAYEKVHGKPDPDALEKGRQEGIAKAKLADAHSVTKASTSGKHETKTKDQEIEDRLSSGMPPGYKA